MEEIEKYFKRPSQSTIKKLKYLKSIPHEKCILEIARLFYYDVDTQIKAVYYINSFNPNEITYRLKKIDFQKKKYDDDYIRLSRRIYISKYDYNVHRKFIEHIRNRYAIGNALRCYNECIDSLKRYGRIKKEIYYRYGHLASIVHRYILSLL